MDKCDSSKDAITSQPVFGKTAINLMIDAVAFALFALLASTGIILHRVLPQGSGSAVVYGLTKHEWGGLHFGLALAFLVAIATHIFIHWSWIACTIRKWIQSGKIRVAIAIGVIGLLVAILALPLLLTPREGAGMHRRHGWNSNSRSNSCTAVTSEGSDFSE